MLSQVLTLDSLTDLITPDNIQYSELAHCHHYHWLSMARIKTNTYISLVTNIAYNQRAY